MSIIEIMPNSNIIYVKYNPVLPNNFTELINDYILFMIRNFSCFNIHLDLNGLNITTLVKNREWIESMMTNLDTNMYNQYLLEVQIFNAPFISKQIYAILSRFVKDLKKKVKFVPKEKKGMGMALLQQKIGGEDTKMVSSSQSR